MVQFEATLQKFEKQADKTGWTYIEIPVTIAREIKAGTKKSFKVKGLLDAFVISQASLIPVGDGNFILPVNAAMRKGTGKRKGARLLVQLEEDKEVYTINPVFLECMAEEPEAVAYFETLTPSHQRYFSKWIDSAKTEKTLVSRIARAVNALSNKMDYGTMLRSSKVNGMP
ncbi:MAG TPA: YdeI/OmpD-associated family protein [Ferruginibacter sp.]|nr:YdeI/OmpD-associated family protein [Ferruginibacter sp.]HMP22141.1 YdeI/OmpD-associated family protein [Ferruginibacter sp.]